MWLLIGKKTRVRRITGGRVLERRCADCEQLTTFAECEVKDGVSLFFVDLLAVTRRRLVCLECGHDVAPEEAPAPAPIGAREADALLAAVQKKLGRAN